MTINQLQNFINRKKIIINKLATYEEKIPLEHLQSNLKRANFSVYILNYFEDILKTNQQLNENTEEKSLFCKIDLENNVLEIKFK